MHKIMLKKYFVEIENCETNAHHVFVINSMMNEDELKNQIEKMYKNNYVDDFIVNVKNYNYLIKIIIDTLKLKNDCVAKNVFFSFF